jgi:hypothetical protein
MENNQSSATTPEDGQSHPEDEMDHCVCDLEMSEDEATDDSALPAAEGGVAASGD